MYIQKKEIFSRFLLLNVLFNLSAKMWCPQGFRIAKDPDYNFEKLCEAYQVIPKWRKDEDYSLLKHFKFEFWTKDGGIQGVTYPQLEAFKKELVQMLIKKCFFCLYALFIP